MKRVLMGVLGVVIGIVVGSTVMIALHLASHVIYPLPEDVDFMSMEPENREKLAEFIGTLPAGAFVLTVLAHGLGCMAGAFVATLVSGRRSMVPALVIGVFYTIGGVMSLQDIPHPAWFPYADLPIYLILAFVAGKLLVRKGETAS